MKTNRSCEACNMLSRGVKFRRTSPHTCDKRVVTDNHQWVKDESYIDQQFKERHVCKVCGCERMLYLSRRQKQYIYSRGGINAKTARPDCVDWNDRESLNSIDKN